MTNVGRTLVATAAGMVLSCGSSDDEKTCPTGGPYGYVYLNIVEDESGKHLCPTITAEPAGELDDKALKCDLPLFWTKLTGRRDVVVTLTMEYYEDWTGTVRAPACDEGAYTMTARMKLKP